MSWRRFVMLLSAVAIFGVARVASAGGTGAAKGRQGGAGVAPLAQVLLGAQVAVLLATNAKKGIDPRIGNMPELENPPFSSYKGYSLLAKVSFPLRIGDSKTFTLPNGRVFQAKLLQVLPNGQVRLSASIDQPGGGAFLPLLEVKAKRGQEFIVAGQSYKGGTLVLVIRVTG